MKHVKTAASVIFLWSVVLVLSATAGDMNPPGAPGSTMKSLNDIPPSWHQIIITGERFEIVMGGEAVLDRETGLVWAKNANILGAVNWATAKRTTYDLVIGNRKGWRLPTIEEMMSLADMSWDSQFFLGWIFNNLATGENQHYWTATTGQFLLFNAVMGWHVEDASIVPIDPDDGTGYVLPVRGGTR